MVSTAGGIVIAVVVILLVAAVGWIVFTQLRARRLGVSCLQSMTRYPLLLDALPGPPCAQPGPVADP